VISSATFLAAAPQPQAFRRPLVFEPNRGQAPAEVKWLARGPGYQLFFTREGVTMMVEERAAAPSRSVQSPARGYTSTLKYSVVRMKLAGSRPWDDLTGLEPTGGVSNYYPGNDAKAWRTNIPHYNRVSARSVYEGIDLVLYAQGGDLEYDFVVKPGADPKKIRLAFEGQRHMRVDDKSGDLVLTTVNGSELRQVRPKVYQPIGNQRVELAGAYELLGRRHAAFALAAYDHRHPLVIDPSLQMMRYLGNQSEGQAIAVDGDGNSWTTGSTGPDLPITNHSQYNDEEDSSFWSTLWSILSGHGIPFQAFPVQGDMFVTKWSPQGTILFSTYYGIGTGLGIAVDSTGAVVTGWRANGNEEVKRGNGLFALKLSLTGDQIYFSVLAGADSDSGTSVALDSQHNAWIAGVTSSAQLTHGSQPAMPDALILKVSPQGAFTWLKTFGGSGVDTARGVAVDGDDSPWFTGQTCSPDFPATPGLNNPTGRCSVFVVRLTNQPQQGTTKFAAVFGGSDPGDSGTAIAVDANRQAYVTGVTKSVLFPVEPGGYQTVPASTGPQAFVIKLDGSGHYVHTTLLGGNGDTFGYSIALNRADEVYVAGSTTSTSFPGASSLYFTTASPAGFVSKFSPDLSALLFTSVIGDAVRGLAVLETVPSINPAQIYAAGYGGTSNHDAIVARLLEDVPADLSQTSPFKGAAQWDSAFGDANGWGLSPSYGTTLMFADINGDGKADVCGRGQAGIYCELSTAFGSFGPLFLAHGAFSDATGWNILDYYASLRFADVNGDRRPDICGRGMAGVYCALNIGNGTFGALQLWDSGFSDANGWGLPQYGTTMMFADINGDGKADVCGRGRDGMWCALSTGTHFGPLLLQQNVFSDAQGWSLLDYYTSLRFADVDGNGRPDICGRGMAGIYCAHNNGNGTFSFPALWDLSSSVAPNLSDADGWGLPQYGSTIMFADINRDGKADVCGRGRAGIWCELSTGTGFGPAFLAQHNFSDAEGWNQLVDYGSLRFADVTGDGKRDICGRGSLGIYCAVAK
jgi:hypothetical protein